MQYLQIVDDHVGWVVCGIQGPNAFQVLRGGAQLCALTVIGCVQVAMIHWQVVTHPSKPACRCSIEVQPRSGCSLMLLWLLRGVAAPSTPLRDAATSIGVDPLVPGRLRYTSKSRARGMTWPMASALHLSRHSAGLCADPCRSKTRTGIQAALLPQSHLILPHSTDSSAKQDKPSSSSPPPPPHRPPAPTAQTAAPSPPNPPARPAETASPSGYSPWSCR